MKKIILIFTIVLLNQGISFCQSNKDCKYTKNTVDEFSKKREVITEMNKIYHRTDLEAGTLGPKKTAFTVGIVGGNFNGQNILRFVVDYFNRDDNDSPINLYILLENDTVIPFSGDWKYNMTENNTVYWLDYKISSFDWEKLKIQSVKKIRMSFSNNTEKTFEVTSKFSKSIQEAIDCIDVLEIPKFTSQTINKKNDTNNSLKENEKNTDELSQSKNDTTTVSIYKQWKVLVSMGKDGLPKSNVNQTIQYYNNGTYKSIIILTNGKKIESKGTFQFMNDNKIIVNTTEDGKISSAAITKLTNKELDLKGEDFQTIYGLY